MNDMPYGVHVVVDPDYGERIRELPSDEPAWIIDSRVNKPVILALWQERQGNIDSDEVTLFSNEQTSTSPEDRLFSQLAPIDLHHGEYSHDPPYSVLHVIGVKWSDRIRNELEEFGFTFHEHTADGFVAKRCVSIP